MEFWTTEEYYDLPLEMQEPPCDEFGLLPPEDAVIPEAELAALPDEFGISVMCENEQGEEKRVFSKLVKKWLYFCAAAIILTAAGYRDYAKALYAEENTVFAALGEMPISVSEEVSEQLHERNGDDREKQTEEQDAVYPLSDEEIRITVFAEPAVIKNGIILEESIHADSFDTYPLPCHEQGADRSFSGYILCYNDPSDPGYDPNAEPFSFGIGDVLTREAVERIPVAKDGIRYINVHPEERE